MNASLAHGAVGTDGARKVDGSVASAPQVSLGGRYFVFSNPPADGAQGLRLMIDLFGEQVNTGLQRRERRMGLLSRINFR